MTRQNFTDAVKGGMPENNIANLRIYRGISQTRLADMSGVPFYTLSRIESGELPFEKYRAVIAKALGFPPQALDSDDLELSTVPIVSIVKWKYFVKDFPGKSKEKAEMIPGLPPTAKALKIKGKHLVPYHGNNEILYFDGKPESNERLFVERECIVEREIKKRGEKLLCWVTAGSRPGHYMLHPYGVPPIIDAKIKAVYPILYVKRS